MKIKISNYRNIKEGELEIETEKVKVLFSLSGTGKTTIAEAIKEKVNKESNFTKSWLFDDEPNISIEPEIKKVVFFNEKTKDDFIFDTPDHRKGVYEIVSSGYDRKKIKKISEDLYDDFISILKLDVGKKLELFFDDNDKFISQMFPKQKKFTHENIIEHREKNTYDKDTIKLIEESSVKYKKWYDEGVILYGMIKKCAFCFNDDLNTLNFIKFKNYNQTNLNRFEDAKETEMFKNLNVNDYIKKDPKELERILKESIPKENPFENFNSIKEEGYKYFVEKLSSFEEFSFSKIAEDYGENKMWLEIIKKSYLTNIIEEINNKITSLNKKYLENLNNIKSEKKKLNEIISLNTERINFLLKKLQLNFKFEKKDISHGEKDITYELKFIPNLKIDSSEIKKTLSYGEKNIIALILTLLNGSAEAFILDDPLSSYDDFRRGIIMFEIMNISKEKKIPILLLTHDEYFIRKIIFDNLLAPSFSISYLNIDSSNRLELKNLKRRDFIGMNEDYLRNPKMKDKHLLLKLIMVRQYLEIFRKNDNEYSELWNWLCDLIKVKKDKGMKYLREKETKKKSLDEMLRLLSKNDKKTNLSNDNFLETISSIFSNEELKKRNNEIIEFLREIENYKKFNKENPITKLLIIKNITDNNRGENYFEINDDDKPFLEAAKDVMHLVNSPFMLLNFQKHSIIRYDEKIIDFKFEEVIKKSTCK